MGAERPPTAAGSSRTATTSTGSPPGSSTWGSSSPGGLGPFRRCPTLDPLGDRVRTAGPRAPPDATPRLADDARPGPGPAARRSVPMAGALEAEEATLRGTCPAPRGTTPAPPPRRARPAPGRDRIPEIPPSPRPPGEPLRKAACRVWPACATRPGSVRAGVIRARLDTAGRGCTCQAPGTPTLPKRPARRSSPSAQALEAKERARPRTLLIGRASGGPPRAAQLRGPR
jgi:hypothetical protein